MFNDNRSIDINIYLARADTTESAVRNSSVNIVNDAFTVKGIALGFVRTE